MLSLLIMMIMINFIRGDFLLLLGNIRLLLGNIRAVFLTKYDEGVIPDCQKI